jgi:hypothetical protein
LLLSCARTRSPWCLSGPIPCAPWPLWTPQVRGCAAMLVRVCVCVCKGRTFHGKWCSSCCIHAHSWPLTLPHAAVPMLQRGKPVCVLPHPLIPALYRHMHTPPLIVVCTLFPCVFFQIAPSFVFLIGTFLCWLCGSRWWQGLECPPLRATGGRPAACAGW